MRARIWVRSRWPGGTGLPLRQPSGGGQRKAEIVVRLREVGVNFERLLILLDGFRNASLFGEHVAEVAMRLSVAGVFFNGQLVLTDRIAGTTRIGQRDGEVVVRFRVLRSSGDSFAELFNCRVGLARMRQGLAEIVVHARIGGAHCNRFCPFGNGRGVLSFFCEVGGEIELLVEVDGRGSDVFYARRRHVDELRNVYGAIGGGRILDEDGRGVVSLGHQCG